MIYVHVNDGLVIDMALFDAPMPETWPDYSNWYPHEEAQIGWTFSGGVFSPPVLPEPPVLPPPPYALPVSVLWSRMTDAEAETFDSDISTASPLRLRRAFNAASSIASDSELFEFVKQVLDRSIAATRLQEILAPYYGIASAVASGTDI